MKFEEIIRSISEQFTRSWNNWDIDRRTNCLTNDVVLTSPNVSKVYPENLSNTICGKENIRVYWNQLAAQEGLFKVEQQSVSKEGMNVITLNKIIGSEIYIKETFTMNEYGKIKELMYEYIYPVVSESDSKES